MNECKVRDFEETFGPEGIWVELLHRSDGYLKTEVKREFDSRFRVTDYWNSHLDFEAFRRQFAAEIERFTRRVAAGSLVEGELLLGSYYEDEPGSSNGDDLVPA